MHGVADDRPPPQDARDEATQAAVRCNRVCNPDVVALAFVASVACVASHSRHLTFASQSARPPQLQGHLWGGSAELQTAFGALLGS